MAALNELIKSCHFVGSPSNLAIFSFGSLTVSFHLDALLSFFNFRLLFKGTLKDFNGFENKKHKCMK